MQVTVPYEELTTDPVVRTFCQQFSLQVVTIVNLGLLIKLLLTACMGFSQKSSSWARFANAVLLECIHHEKLQALTPYLQLEQVSNILSNKACKGFHAIYTPCCLFAFEFLVCSEYLRQPRRRASCPQPLANQTISGVRAKCS